MLIAIQNIFKQQIMSTNFKIHQFQCLKEKKPLNFINKIIISHKL